MQLSGSVPKLSQCGDIPSGRAIARDGLSCVPFEVGEATFAAIRCNLTPVDR